MQNDKLPVMLGEGLVFNDVVMEFNPVQPLAFVTVTVKVPAVLT